MLASKRAGREEGGDFKFVMGCGFNCNLELLRSFLIRGIGLTRMEGGTPHLEGEGESALFREGETLARGEIPVFPPSVSNTGNNFFFFATVGTKGLQLHTFISH